MRKPRVSLAEFVGLLSAAGMLIAGIVASRQAAGLTPEMIQHAREQWATNAVAESIKGANVRPVVGEADK